jgi:hypothetical protein
MQILIIVGFLLVPVVGMVWWLASQRRWRGLILFGALAGGFVALGLYVGYLDYKSTQGEEFLDMGMRAHMSLFGLAGLLAADWLAVGWGAWTWLTGRGGETVVGAERPERRERRRAA